MDFKTSTEVGDLYSRKWDGNHVLVYVTRLDVGTVSYTEYWRTRAGENVITDCRLGEREWDRLAITLGSDWEYLDNGPRALEFYRKLYGLG